MHLPLLFSHHPSLWVNQHSFLFFLSLFLFSLSPPLSLFCVYSGTPFNATVMHTNHNYRCRLRDEQQRDRRGGVCGCGRLGGGIVLDSMLSPHGSDVEGSTGSGSDSDYGTQQWHSTQCAHHYSRPPLFCSTECFYRSRTEI